MNAAKKLDDLSTQVIDIVTEAHRSGIEEGIRRICQIGRVVGHDDLFREIVKLDKEFGLICPCTSFKEGHCERCGATDVFSIARKFSACTDLKPISG